MGRLSHIDHYWEDIVDTKKDFYVAADGMLVDIGYRLYNLDLSLMKTGMSTFAIYNALKIFSSVACSSKSHFHLCATW